MPSPHNKYIFNGDFIDRGPMGVEITTLLLGFHAVAPGTATHAVSPNPPLMHVADCVYLNRGNHEDYAICSSYGFQDECTSKYDMVTYGMFLEVFKHLPLCVLVNEGVLVVHGTSFCLVLRGMIIGGHTGGLFHATDIRLQDLNEIPRTVYTLDMLPEGGTFSSVRWTVVDSHCVFLRRRETH